ncbi:MAG: hypothetical protein QOJ65_70 [Fimbriimonadaceae bacterium]|nr:hypothetical protein [Fimbriimonadaceae bacterium]
MLAALVPMASADSAIDIERNRVVPVRLNDDLSIRYSERGDRFTATVDNDYDLPTGTQLMGRVLEVHRKADREAPYLEVGFDEIRLPDGTRESIKAAPVSMENGIVKRNRDGHYYATRKVVRRDQALAGGAIAGLVIGSIFKKPVEGAIIGAVAGIIVGEKQASIQETATLPRGSRMGAMFERPMHVVYTGTDWRRDAYAYDRNDSRNDTTYDNRDDRGWRTTDTYRSDRSGQNERYSETYRSDRAARITFRDRVLRFSGAAQPFYIGNTVMAPLSKTASQLGLTVDSYTSDGTILVEDSRNNLRLEQGSRDYRLNGRYGTMSKEVQVRDGVTYVPLEVLALMKREPIYANGTRVEMYRD